MLRTEFLQSESPKLLFILNAVAALVYFVILAFYFPMGNPVLFALLILGEIFHVWQVLTFLYTVWDTEYQAPFVGTHQPGVDVFITVCGEPVEVVEATARAAIAMRYPDFSVHLLNDGLVANKENWRDIERLAAELGINCITRRTPGGAKAGNINHALSMTAKPLIAIFDADHIPHPEFLGRMTGYFADPKMAFVQAPQYYRNWNENFITRSSWEQQELFFGAICRGKNRLNAATMCGTNMVISRTALEAVGGIHTDTIVEDFVTGLYMHARGFRSVYVPEVLSYGLATEDLLTYSNQQFRWARGSLDVIFRYNPFFIRGLTMAQRIHYLAGASFFRTGTVVVIDALLPVIYFYTGLVPVNVSGMMLALVFLPYIFLTFYTLERASNWSFTFSAMGFSVGSFPIHLRALWAALTRQKSAFAVSSKQALAGNYLRLARWHIAYIVIAVLGLPVALAREGFSASFVNNLAWAAVNSAVFLPFILAAMPQKKRMSISAPATAQLETAM
jgi:cellulose synthase (UDP-forming)